MTELSNLLREATRLMDLRDTLYVCDGDDEEIEEIEKRLEKIREEVIRKRGSIL